MGRSPLRNALNHPDLVSQKFATIPSDTGHSIHDEKNPYADHSDGVSSIDAAKRPVEGPQKSSYIMEETVPLNYDTFLQDNEHQQRAGCRGFPALCFPPNTLAVNPEHLWTEGKSQAFRPTWTQMRSISFLPYQQMKTISSRFVYISSIEP